MENENNVAVDSESKEINKKLGNEIKDLMSNGSSRKITKMVDAELTSVDFTTGEIKESHKLVVKKFQKQDEYIKFFVDNFDYLIKLTNTEKNILFLIMKDVNPLNCIVLNGSFKKYLCDRLGLTKSPVYYALNSLIEKEVLLMVNEEMAKKMDMYLRRDEYMVNPNLTGRASFRDMAKLRRSIIEEYDFEKKTYIKQLDNTVFLKGADILIENPQNYVVEEVKRIQDGKNIHTEVLVSEKDSDEECIEASVDDLQPDDKINKEIELERLKSDNYSKEIYLKELELKTIQLKMELNQANK